MSEVKTKTVYITDAQDFSEIELKLRKMVDSGYIEKKEDQIVMSKAEFEKYISDAFIAGFDSSLMATPNKEEYLTNLIK